MYKLKEGMALARNPAAESDTFFGVSLDRIIAFNLEKAGNYDLSLEMEPWRVESSQDINDLAGRLWALMWTEILKNQAREKADDLLSAGKEGLLKFLDATKKDKPEEEPSQEEPPPE